jgi:hypothetical protein
LPDILKDLGIKKFRVSNLYKAGCLLKEHADFLENDTEIYAFRTNTGNGWSTVENAKLLDGVTADTWDYITFQQGSTKSGLPDSYSYLTEIIDTIEALQPQAKLAWHMTWAYQQDYTSDAFTNNYGGKQTTMYNAIVNSVKSKILSNYDINFVIPNGTVVQNARTSFLGDTITRDGFHMSYDIGRYMTALTYAYLMTGYSLDDVTYKPDGVSDEVKAVCVESVKNAIVKPYTVTKSAYPGTDTPTPTPTPTPPTTIDPSVDLSQNYVQMATADYGWTDFGYWNSKATNGKHYSIDTEDSKLSKCFVCTKMFTKAELPVGTVIEIDSGYKYRADGWVGTGVQSSRPEPTSTTRIVITEAWWGSYDTRAFNISNSSVTALTDTAAAKAAFRIWLPK